jgi:heme/copper-type cytochrome/quinol oxidase subunit 2
MNEIAFISSTFFTIAKFGMIVFLFVYVIFSVIVVRQVKTMTDTLNVGFENQIKALALIHVVAAILVLAISFFVL